MLKREVECIIFDDLIGAHELLAKKKDSDDVYFYLYPILWKGKKMGLSIKAETIIQFINESIEKRKDN